MARVRGSIEIRRPVDEVFDVVADQRNEPSYNPKMIGSVKVTDGPVGAGTRFRATVVSGGRPLDVAIECTDLDRPHRVASRSVMTGAVVEGEVRCRPAQLSWDWDVAVSGPGRIAAPLVGWLGSRQERTIWTGLKRLLENRDGAP